jgi:hypothetical protein
VVLPAMLGWETVRPALRCWLDQTEIERLEIVLVAPDADEAASRLPASVVPVASGSLLLHEARAAGIRRSSGSHVVIAEDHCVPDPDFLTAVLRSIDEGAEILGPALRPGNPQTAIGQAAFLLGYGEWLAPPSGPASSLPGHNVVVRRELLIDGDVELERELILSAFLVERLRRDGARARFVPDARMRHFDYPEPGAAIRIFATVGMGFGALRTRAWPAPGRWLYPFAAPAIAAKHWLRGAREFRRAGRRSGLDFSCLLACVPLAVAWACGEAVGALLGADRVAPWVWRSEVKPVTSEMLRESSRRESERPDGSTAPVA